MAKFIGGRGQNTIYYGNTVKASVEVLTNEINGYDGTAVDISGVVLDNGTIYGTLAGGAGSYYRTVDLTLSGGSYNTFPDAMAAAVAMTPFMISIRNL